MYHLKLRELTPLRDEVISLRLDWISKCRGKSRHEQARYARGLATVDRLLGLIQGRINEHEEHEAARGERSAFDFDEHDLPY